MCSGNGCIFGGLENVEGVPMASLRKFHNSHYSKYPNGLGRHGIVQGHGKVQQL
jgi:hypothetical protein